MKANKTAVEWFYELAKQRGPYFCDFQEALKMEKKQIMDAYGQGVVDEAKEILDVTKDSKRYYDNTYGK